MIVRSLIVIAMAAGAFPHMTPAQTDARLDAQLPVYTVKRTTEPIVIDGVLDDPDWSGAETVGPFSFLRLDDAPGTEQTAVKALWDDDFLYLAWQVEDAHIWADHYDTNADTYKDDAVELFWNPAPDSGLSYYMFEINCIGNLLSVVNHWQFSQSIHIRESRILPPHIAQSIQGTVNNDADTDTGWIIELALRFEDYDVLSETAKPNPGGIWRVGLNRIGGRTNPQYGQWSPVNRSEGKSFHSPRDFGTFIFSADPVR